MFLAALIALAASGTAIVAPSASASTASVFAARLVSNPQQGVPYTIRAESNHNMCLDVRDLSQSNGALFQMYQCLGPSQKNQIFYLWNVPDTQIFQVQVAHSWKCMDVQGYSYQDWAAIQQYDCLGMSQQNQLFGIPSPESPCFCVNIVALHSWKYIHIGLAENGASVVQHWNPSSWHLYQY